MYGYTDIRPQYTGVKEVCRNGSWCCWERAVIPSSPWSRALIPQLNSPVPCTDTSIHVCVHWDWWSEQLTLVKRLPPPVPCATASMCCSVWKEGIILGVRGTMSKGGRDNHFSQLQLWHTVAPNTYQTAAWKICVWRIHALLLSTSKGQSLKFHTQLAPC